MVDLNSRILDTLFENQDLGYREFHSKLMPGYDVDNIIGVRTPVLRKIAKEYSKDPQIDIFLHNLPHRYYEEMNLHGFIISEFKDYRTVIDYLEDFLPLVDNWATCDLLRPKVFKKHKDELIKDIRRWMSSDKLYTIRFGIEMLMTFFLDEDFKEEYLEWVSEIKSDEYYLNMMIAWYFATAMAKQWDETVKYIENDVLDKWTHNKAIQKAIESYRITDEQKLYLRTLKK